MKNIITVMFVEDCPEQIANCKLALEKIMAISPIQINPLFIGCLDEAVKSFSQADAVIENISFPKGPGEKTQGFEGSFLAGFCINKAMPIVTINSSYDGAKSWIQEKGLEVFACSTEKASNNMKPWEEAIVAILAMYAKIHNGEIFVSERRMVMKYGNHELACGPTFRNQIQNLAKSGVDAEKLSNILK